MEQSALKEILDTLENDWLSPQPYIDLVKSKLEKEKATTAFAKEQINEFIELIKTDKQALIKLKDLAVECKAFEFASYIRDIEKELPIKTLQ